MEEVIPMNIDQARRLFATREFRELNKCERAVLLVKNNVSQRKAATFCGISRPTLQRALAAKKVGRNVGVRGRPHILTGEQEDEFMEVLKKKYEGKDFHICDVRAQVRKTYYYLTLTVFFELH